MNNKMIFDTSPARGFNDSYLLGNGRSGVSVLGRVEREAITLNEDSVWYGKDYDRKNPHAKDSIEKIRELLFQEKPDEALILARKTLYSSPKYINPYVPLATLEILDETKLSNQMDYSPVPCYTEYERYLDLEKGIAGVSYKENGVVYKREIFCSYPDDVTVIRLDSDTPESISFSAFLHRYPFDDGGKPFDDRSVIMSGKNGEGGVEFSCILRAINDGGEINIYNDTISMEGCNSVTLLICTATSYREADYTKAAADRIEKVSKMDYAEIKNRHIADHSTMFGRVQFSLTPDSSEKTLSTKERIENIRNGKSDNGLFELAFNFGRYILMASSRARSLPANLQGIWNPSFTPNWKSAYTVNINTQMNYWAAESGNLSECHLPLLDFMEKVREKGQATAKEVYNCRGFVAHHNLNLYGDSDFEGRFNSCVVWPMGGAWLSLHLWNHYEYTLDTDFLKNKAYPILKDAALFMLDYMVEGENGELLTGPSLSPENTYKTEDGRYGTLCMAPAMDIQIVKELFDSVIKACDILKIDDEFKSEILSARKRLPKDKISSDGRLLEWQKEYEEVERNHRHLSHLFGLFPGGVINDSTPELMEAAKNSLKVRTDSDSFAWGWTGMWCACLYARLCDGESAYKMLKKYLESCISYSMMDIISQSHNYFQIDANLGYPAAVIELLMQSSQGKIKILPSLPDKWESGSICGLKAKGGFEVDIKWENKKPVYVKIKASISQDLTLIFPDGVNLSHGDISGNIVTIPAEAGKEYIFT